MGYRKCRSTIKALFVLKQVIEKIRECNQETHIASVDLEKAFDNVHLRYYGISSRKEGVENGCLTQLSPYINIRKLSSIWIVRRLLDAFLTNKVVRQGCCVSHRVT